MRRRLEDSADARLPCARARAFGPIAPFLDASGAVLSATRRPTAPAHGAGQFALLGQRRFAPFFWTQFLGAANDNIFKFAVTMLVTYQLAVGWLPPTMAGLVIGAVFIAPFLLFSATCGQVADKVDKARLMRAVKTLEVGIMLLAAWGWMQPSPALLLACIFLMGTHSALFGPAKYAYLPQHLDERELTGGNALVELGTFVAILLGNVAGGLLVTRAKDGWLPGPQAVALACLAVAVVGWLSARRIPASPAPDPSLRIRWNPFAETWRNLQMARGDALVFRALLGISWMWFFGAVFLSLFPVLAKDVLHGDEQVAALLLVVFSIGIGCGALLCEKLGGAHVEIGLVPIGGLAMSLFAADLHFATRALPMQPLQPLDAFLAHAAHWRVLADLGGLALGAGIYSVPLYAMVQWRAPVTHRARIVAANNILNALFMVVSALIVGALIGAGVTVPQVFGLMALVNAAALAAMLWAVPLLRTRLAQLLARRGGAAAP